MPTILVFSDDRFSPLSDRKASIFGFISFSRPQILSFHVVNSKRYIIYKYILFEKQQHTYIYIFLYKKIKKSIKGLG